MNQRDYALVTGSYWAFTLTDGALRMLVLLHFHELGYSAASLAFLFLLYELVGIATNLLGGWVGARSGLRRTLQSGLGLQVVALLVLSTHSDQWAELASVAFVMCAQAVSGVAKDLTKMSSKSAVKFFAAEGSLFRLVALLTGSKNALKGVGFFVGSVLLASIGYRAALWTLAALVAVALASVVLLVRGDIGAASAKPPLRSVLSKSPAVNRLSFARFFLFGSRDIWFVVALPVFLDERLGWSFEAIGAFLAAWVIGYGIIQTVAPRAVRLERMADPQQGQVRAARRWAAWLGAVSAAIAVAVAADVAVTLAVVGGLLVFGVVFAVNSSLHSYLILAFSEGDEVAMDVGFYYSANAAGRLVGTMLSGALYLWGGLAAALWGSTAFVGLTWLASTLLPARSPEAKQPRRTGG